MEEKKENRKLRLDSTYVTSLFRFLDEQNLSIGDELTLIAWALAIIQYKLLKIPDLPEYFGEEKFYEVLLENLKSYYQEIKDIFDPKEAKKNAK